VDENNEEVKKKKKRRLNEHKQGETKKMKNRDQN
jgi:hypothetical protein